MQPLTVGSFSFKFTSNFDFESRIKPRSVWRYQGFTVFIIQSEITARDLRFLSRKQNLLCHFYSTSFKACFFTAQSNFLFIYLFIFWRCLSKFVVDLLALKAKENQECHQQAVLMEMFIHMEDRLYRIEKATTLIWIFEEDQR